MLSELMLLEVINFDVVNNDVMNNDDELEFIEDLFISPERI